MVVQGEAVADSRSSDVVRWVPLDLTKQWKIVDDGGGEYANDDVAVALERSTHSWLVAEKY